jgi:large subunit ribosomal protein L23
MNKEQMLMVLVRPVVTEKTSLAQQMSNVVCFRVLPSATKLVIKKAVESLFSVAVESVNVVAVKGKLKRRGKTVGRTKSWKKAYVRLLPGQEINFEATKVS